MIGFDMLPKRVREKYQLKIKDGRPFLRAVLVRMLEAQLRYRGMSAVEVRGMMVFNSVCVAPRRRFSFSAPSARMRAIRGRVKVG